MKKEFLDLQKSQTFAQFQTYNDYNHSFCDNLHVLLWSDELASFVFLLFISSKHFISEKLLLSSRKPEDYGFLVKGCYTVDGIDDHEEFGFTEVMPRL